ncbi:esterase [Campylobacterota bacterium]|nr:esterase [Campylobacterota bacterium]
MKPLFAFLFAFALCFGVKLETITVKSAAMNKEISVNIALPYNYSPDKRYPVVYLLHGYDGDYTSWVGMARDAIEYSANYRQMIFVMPDGGFNSWYIDSAVDPKVRYETFIAKELVKAIDDRYSTLKQRESRAITGYGMGGYGAFNLAIRNPQLFGVVGSISGAVDLPSIAGNWDLEKRFGTFRSNVVRWETSSIINMITELSKNPPKIIFDSGSEGIFYADNLELHNRLLKRKVPHTYISREGQHTPHYANLALRFQLLFIAGEINALRQWSEPLIEER